MSLAFNCSAAKPKRRLHVLALGGPAQSVSEITQNFQVASQLGLPTPANVLKTGGYSGLDSGKLVLAIVDSLLTGKQEFGAGRAFYAGDIADRPLIDRIFADHPDIGAVIHAAALVAVPGSVADPIGYYRANVAKSREFVAHMLRNGCER